jgi:hypothetical protein
MVNVLANDRLIAQTTVSATGAWSVVTSSLDDGVYKLATEVRTIGGGVIKQNVGRSLTIDGRFKPRSKSNQDLIP